MGLLAAVLLCWSLQTVAGYIDCSVQPCIVSCSARITVDPDSTVDCVSLLMTGSVENQTCNSLQDVLNGLAEVSGYSGDDCIVVDVFPGTHTVTRNVTIDQNLVLAGVASSASAHEQTPDNQALSMAAYDAKIQFLIPDELLPSNESELLDAPFHVLSFVGGVLLSVEHIQMTGSPGSLEIVNVSNVEINSCSFSYFSQGAVDIYNSLHVSLTSCDFFHNGPVHVVNTQEYRGHAGGLSIGYNYIPELGDPPFASITGCRFFNNTAQGSPSFSTPMVLIKRVFPGRGGALSLLINSITMVTINVTNCDFLNNFATSSGGGVYTILDGLSNHIITFQSCDFVNNLSGDHAGGLEIEFGQNGNEDFSNRVVAHDCQFLGNEAEYGGAVYVFYIALEGFDEGGNTAVFERCEFRDNRATEVGAAFGAVSHRFFDNKENSRPLLVVNCTFISNEVERGATVSAAFFPLTFSGVNTFNENNGPSLVVIGSLLRVYGVLRFRNNNLKGLGGGTLYVVSQGQVLLFPDSKLIFEDNRGVLGSATVIETLPISRAFSSLLHNKLCFLRYEDTTLSPLDWHKHNVSVEYIENSAIVGSAVFTDNMRLCSWDSLSPPYFNLRGAFHWPFITLKNNSNMAHHPNATDPKWAAQTPAFHVNILNTSVSAFAGDDILLGIESKDELGDDTPTILRLSQTTSGPMASDLLTYKFSPSTITHDRLLDGHIMTSVLQFSSAARMDQTITMETLLTTKTSADEFTLSSILCPAGYTLTPHTTFTDFSVCSCDVDHTSILDCDGRKIILEDGLWGFVGKGKNDFQDPLETYPCPLGYCRCEFRTEGNSLKCLYTVDDRRLNDQCVCGREGVLCGSCRGGKGVTVLRNRCATCHDGFTVFIATLIVADAVVMVLMLAYMIPVPASLLPGIFYIQILPYLTEHFPVTFEKVHPFMLYVSNAIGLYFPYDFCLYDDMPALVSHSLRYLPLLTAILVTPVVLFIRRAKFHPAPMHGVAWIIILLYTPLLHTSMTALQCPQIAAGDSARAFVWYRSGDQQCFSGGHVPLALVGVLTLLLLLSAIPTVILFSLNKIKSSRFPAHLLVTPFSHMYRSQCVWWCGVELGRRVVLVLFIVAFPGNDYPAYFTLAVLVTVQAYVQPYRRWLWNVLELVMSLNVMILLLIRNTDNIGSLLQTYSDQMGNSRAGISSSGSGGSSGMAVCSDEVVGVTPFARLLAVFYYLSLLVFLSVAGSWLVLQLWSSPCFLRLRYRLFAPTLEAEDSSLSLELKKRPPPTTTVDLDELSKCPPEDSIPRSTSGASRVTGDKIHQWVNSFRRKLASPYLAPSQLNTASTAGSPNAPFTINNPTVTTPGQSSDADSKKERETVKMTYSVVGLDEDTPPNSPGTGDVLQVKS